MIERPLTQAGYSVQVAQSGEAALEYLGAGQKSSRPDLIISDIKMPGLGGPALYNYICKQEPALASRVLLITGDTLNPETQAFLQRTHLPYLTKPFKVEALLRLVTQLLRGENGSSISPRY